MRKHVNRDNEQEADIFKMKFLKIYQVQMRYNLGEDLAREVAITGGATYKVKNALLINADKFEKALESYAVEPMLY